MNLDTADPAPHAGASLYIASRSLLLWGMSLSVAALGVGLLLDEQPGLNWTLWTWLATAGFVFWACRQERALGTRRTTMVALICVLASSAAITGMLALQVAIAAGVIVLAGLLVIETGDIPEPVNPARIVAAPLVAAVEVVEEAQLRSAEMTAVLRTQRSLPALRGCLIAAPILIAFFLLLSGADPTLAQWRDTAWSGLSSFAFVPRALFFIVLGIATLGAYGIAARSPTHADESARTAAEPAGVLGSTERLIVLGAVAALFGWFLILQITYLFEDAGSRAGSGLTYAEAAQRGFIELTLTAMLAALLIIVLQKLARPDARERQVRYWALLLIAEVLPMLLSADSRLGHYEAAYGYSLLRLYAHIYIALVGVAMLLLMHRVLTGMDLLRLGEHIGVAVIVACAGLAFWNHAAWIVERNLERHAAGSPLDTGYLERLAAAGSDATPALVAALEELDKVDAQLQQLRFRLLADADAARDTHAAWYRWNLRRAEARQALTELRAGNRQLR